MKIGFIGAGNMGGALARGLGVPVLVTDPAPGKAGELAGALGGEALASAAEVAQRADAVVLAHKPDQLRAVADGLDPKVVISILGGTALADVEAVYPDRPVYRFMPNIPAEAGRGVLCYAPGTRASEGPEDEIMGLFARAGTVIPVKESLMGTATALMGCGPAFFSLVVEALVDAGVRKGLPPADAARMATETMAGTAAVLADNGYDTTSLRRRVTSPGGSTARGLAALERGGLRAAFSDAVDAVGDS
jgi:pyrroline-5-carboxylate reductase